MDDDEFSSGSSESSIVPSQLMGDWRPQALEKTPANNNSSEKEDSGVSASVEAQSRVDTPQQQQEEEEEDNTIPSPGKMKIVIGESVLRWQRQKRNQSFTENTNLSEYVSVRDNRSTTASVLPLDNNATITATPPTATIMSGDKKYTGKYASLKSSNPFVECVAVYDKDRKVHVLEVVSCISHLKQSSEVDSSAEAATIPASHPREQQRKAEERVKKKRKQKAATSPKAKKPKPAKEKSPNKQQLPKVKYRGVTAVKRKNESIVYRSQITLDGKAKYLGTFSTPEEAAKRYDQEASKKTKNVCLNFPPNEEAPEDASGEEEKS